MKRRKTAIDFTKKEADERFEAALRGARLAEPTPMRKIAAKVDKRPTKSTKTKPVK